MRHTILGVLTALVCLHFLGSLSYGQMVQVGPGFVRAPFASVDWYPDGSTHVRTPWVNYYTPGFRRLPADYYARPAPDVAQLDWQALRNEIRGAVADFENDLNRFQLGYTWKAHLKTDDIATLVDAPRVDASGNAPPSLEVREQLHEILQLFEGVSKSEEYRKISALSSYQYLQELLAEYAAPPETRLRRQLYLAAADLNRALKNFKTGEGWQSYLETSTGRTLAPASDAQSQSAAADEDFSQLLARFESVNRNADYRVIAAEPAFKATHELLAAYVDQTTTSGGAAPEELPAPSANSAP